MYRERARVVQPQRATQGDTRANSVQTSIQAVRCMLPDTLLTSRVLRDRLCIVAMPTVRTKTASKARHQASLIPGVEKIAQPIAMAAHGHGHDGERRNGDEEQQRKAKCACFEPTRERAFRAPHTKRLAPIADARLHASAADGAPMISSDRSDTFTVDTWQSASYARAAVSLLMRPPRA